VADLLSRSYSHPTIPFWNALVRLSFFLIVSFTLTSLQAARTRQEEMMHFIVHDLKSPLSNVSIGLDLLRDTASAHMDKDEQAIIAMCIASCDRTTTLINSLLDLARLESGKLPLQRREARVKEMIEIAAQQTSAFAMRRNVALVTHFDEEATVFADFDVTVRILVNLLSNAIKFSPEQATVTINAVPRDNHVMTFTVTDTGPGIPIEWQDKVFDSFTQIDAHKAGYATGSGLGLTFCRAAIEAQGGHIWIQSELGKGTTMIFTLPIQAGER
jgi:signal transduction histidine kinase